jgi:hypothetical protein
MQVEVGIGGRQDSVRIETNQFRVVTNGTYQTTTSAFPSSDLVFTTPGKQKQVFGTAFEKFAFTGGDATNSLVNGVLLPTLGFSLNVVNKAKDCDAWLFYMKRTGVWTVPGAPTSERGFFFFFFFFFLWF